MIIVSNRNLQPDKVATRRFGKLFNEKGPDELRLGVAAKGPGGWKVDILPDRTTFRGRQVFSSEKLFVDLQSRMKNENRNCVFFVHGFNNDFKDVLERGRLLERNFGVEVIIYTWPSDGREGGGLIRKIKGVAAYKSDKRDAARSVVALDRIFEKLGTYLDRYWHTRCEQRMTLFLHSMGNYLFKHLLKSSVYQGESALFDNVILCAADVNHRDHAQWVDRVETRRRLYITINEDDAALLSSRLKFGEKQQARLGHLARGLDSKQATYVDFTGADLVESDHAYFEKSTLRNPALRRFWQKALNGDRAEEDLQFDPRSGAFILR